MQSTCAVEIEAELRAIAWANVCSYVWDNGRMATLLNEDTR